MKQTDDGKKHLGDRVSEDVVTALKGVSKAIKISKQQLTEDAITLWMGKTDPMAEARREMALRAFNAGKVKRPFKYPLAPFGECLTGVL